ncbi:MAG: helicase C-terminal domain-containing protein [Candidatus Freyrarchaeum guaymaensis]
MKEDTTKSLSEQIRTYFPYRPYPQQERYMRDVRSLVEKGGVGFLEAPTGFGKTIAILAATVGTPYRIFYYSRTHAQMRQVAYELGKINELGNRITGVVRGSRIQLCLDEELRRSNDYIYTSETCLSRIRSFEDDRSLVEIAFSRPEVSLTSHERLPTGMDLYCKSEIGEIEIPSIIPRDAPTLASVENMLEYGLEHRVCPYYLARLLAQTYKVVIGAYNYLFIDANYQNQIVVLDEAHNMEDFLKDTVSFKLSRLNVEQALDEIKEVKRPWASDVEEFLAFLLRFFNHADLKDEELLTKELILSEMNEHGVTRERIKNFLDNWPIILNIQRELIAARGRIIILDRMRTYWVYNFFENFFNSSEEFYVGVWNLRHKNNPQLEWLCLEPRIAFDQILSENPRTVILTSGTLSPLKGTAERLGLKDPFLQSYPTIIPEENILILSISRGLNKKTLTTRFELRKDKETLLDYGRTIVKLINTIPHGTIVFFPSYELMNTMLDLWEKHGVLDDLQAPAFFETRGSKPVLADMYSREAARDRAALFAVIRGKLSEGQNFPDEAGRAVILVGVPYPNTKDPRVKAQREYYERKQKGMGSKWYLDQAFNAVNQSLGRVWRHKSDYAIGILLDSRYTYRTNQSRLASWLAQRTTPISSHSPFITVEKIIRDFFQQP